MSSSHNNKDGKDDDVSTNKNQELFFVGSYTQVEGHVPNGCGEGIYSFWFDNKTGKITPANNNGGTSASATTSSNIKNPTYLHYDDSATSQCLYAIEEIGSTNELPSHIICYKVNISSEDQVTLTETSRMETDLLAGCHLTLHRSSSSNDDEHYHQTVLLVASYLSGNLCTVPISTEDGNLPDPSTSVQHKYSGNGPNKARQEAPHAHQVFISPIKRGNNQQTQQFVYVCDLGSDTIWCHDINQILLKKKKKESSTSSMTPIHAIKCPPGSGPRHLVFHPNYDVVYVLCELTGDLLTYKFDSTTGLLTLIDQIPSLPKDFTGEPSSAGIRIHPTGTTLYVSNRGITKNENTIAMFPIITENNSNIVGKLVASSATWVESGGITPRDFNLDSTGQWLIVGNQDDNTLAVFQLVEQVIHITTTRKDGDEEASSVIVQTCQQPPTIYPCKTPACITMAK